MYIAWKNLAEYNIGPSESSGRNGRAKESRMNELNKLSAIEAKLDALIHWMNKKEVQLETIVLWKLWKE